MNSEELKKNFSLLMPSEINGFKRPKEPIANDNDFFLEVPQLIQKDPVLYSTMNLILGVLVSNDKLLKQWHDTLQNVVNAQDWRVVTDSLKGYMTPELKKKLDGIAAGANNYIHPSTHPASMITQDTTHRFVTDTEKTTWNGKASTAVVSTTANGLMPKRDGSATSIFTGDGVWKSLAWNLITGKPSTFAPSAHNHDSSYLKRNQTTQNDMNVCTVEGIYRFSGNLSNAWTGTSWGTLLVFNNNYNGGSGTGGTYLVQMALPTDGRIWIRQRVNTEAWSGWVKVAITSDTVAGATKATQDKNGKDITGYLYKTEDLTLNPDAEILIVGNISEILNSFCTKFKQIQGTGTYAENSPTSIKSLNDNKAPKTSPAFSGTPTAPTPGVDTNNTQLATCGFVRNAIAKYAPMLDTMKKIYPVGSIYMSTVSTNPATLFGFGRWEAMPAGRVLLAQGTASWGTYNAGSTGGEATHQLTVGELPAHNHSASTNTTGSHAHTYTWRNYQGWAGSKSATKVWEDTATNNTGSAGDHSHTVTINNTGSNQAHNNLQPYISVYIWKRTV